MKKSIGKKVMVLVFGPFLLILVALSAYISYMVIQNSVGWTELELKGITDINASQLEGRINSVRITVLSAAESLGKIDGENPDARRLADEAVRVMFINESVYNAWLVYEPNAFDGQDARHTKDYPGAPSGRFMLSYVKERDRVIMAPDMDEQTIDNAAESPWYVIPRDAARLYIDVTNDTNENLYDYGVGGEPVYTLSVVMPLLRDGKVIGCVGADVLFDTMTFGIDNAKNAAVAVFYPDGRVFFAKDIRFAEDSIDTLGFFDATRIRKAFTEGESLFLPDEFCPFLAERAFLYLHPIHSEGMDDNNLFLYVALPRSAVLAGMAPMLAPVAIITALFLVAVCVLYIYAHKKIFRPVRQLTLSANAISQGDLQTGVTLFSHSEDEIGTLSRSLQRMVEQFRIYIMQQDQIKEEGVLRAILRSSSEAPNRPAIYASLTAMLREHFQVYHLTLVLLNAGKAIVTAKSSAEDAEPEAMAPADFIYHAQVTGLLMPDRKLVFQNKSAIARHRLMFLREDTLSTCVLPLRNELGLVGYLIFENRDLTSTFGPGTEALLLYVSQILPPWLGKLWRKDEDSKPLPDAGAQDIRGEADEWQAPLYPADGFMEALRHIDGLYAHMAVEAMGGLVDVYKQSLRLLVRTAPDSLRRMDSFLQGGDIPAFAIEIHGLKGGLNNIGATELGSMASSLERMAKEEADPSLCAEPYAAFKTRLTGLLDTLSQLPGDPPQEALSKGDRALLKSALHSVREATQNYDSLEASDILAPLLAFRYGEETDKPLRELADLLHQFECEKAMEILQTLLGGSTK